MKSKLILILGLLPLGCGKSDQPLMDSPSAPSIAVRILMPVSITGSAARYARFRSRVRYLELRAIEADGRTLERKIAPGDWDRLSLESWTKTLSGAARWKLKAKVWDVSPTGELRSYPALTGEMAVKREELGLDKINELPLKLSLKVSVRDYD